VDVVQVQNTEEGAQVMHGRVRPLQARRAGRGDRGWRDRDRGTLPINTDGGCIANGEPIGASGLRQVYETVPTR
jgi:acetyl-CoA acetyltransferase